MKVTSAAIPPAATHPAPGDATLEASFEWCRRLSRKRARNFYYGMKLTPPDKRRAMYAVYAWMRAADDVADKPDGAIRNGRIEARVALLETLREQTGRALDPEGDPIPDDGEPHAPMWPAVRQTFLQYAIPCEYLHAMIDGQLLDVRRHAYRIFDDLYDYCYKVASVVGLTCIEVWGYDNTEATRKLAEHRGIAFQLTNILRDVVEDAQRGRTYLPAEDFQTYGLNPSQLTAKTAGHAFNRFIRYQVERAMSYYDRSRDLEKHLAPSCRATSWAMMRTYRGLLERIGQHPRRVLTGRIRLSSLRKTSIVLSAACRREY